ncbi:MAG TPA: hypothetical protein VEL73_06870 [Mycobacteriales bacterium]|nr:hypothetical protein [Mycobacteriales bacterium]
MRRHEVDVFSLVFGLLFVGAALVWGLARNPDLALRGWPLPTLLIGVGVAGLLASLAAWRRGGRPRDGRPADASLDASDETG